MAQIVQILGSDNQLLLGREQYIRRVASMGYNWNWIRVAIRYSVYGSQDGAATTYFRMGLSAGLSQYYDAGADIVGFAWGPAWWYQNQTLFRTQSTNFAVFTKVGSTLTTVAVGINDAAWAAGPANHCVLWVDLKRSGSLIQIIGSANRSYTTWPDYQLEDLLAQVELEIPVRPTQSVVQGGFSGTPAYGGSGLLDSVWMSWNDPILKFLVSDIVVVRFV